MNEQQANQLFAQAFQALQAGKPVEAERILKKLDNAIPGNPGIIYYLGVTASLQGRKEQAINIYERVIRLNPQFVEAYNNQGLDFDYLGMHQEAAARFKRALEIRSDFVEAYQNLGVSLNHLKRYEEALQSFLRALHLRPNFGDALVSMGGALIGLKRYTDAEQALKSAIDINPGDSKAYYNLGMLLVEVKRYDEARLAYEEALHLNPQYTDAYQNLAALHSTLGAHTESISAYKKALDLDSSIKWLPGLLLHAEMKICDWHAYAQSLEKLISPDMLKNRVAAPFTLLGLPSSPLAQKVCAETYTHSETQPPHYTPQPSLQVRHHNKTRIAYLSADYYSHATIHLMSELFELHDRGNFEVFGICYGRSPQDQVRAQVAAKFDQFIEIGDKTDAEIAELIRSLEIDIAVDLKGHTQDARLGIFASRIAPVQLHYLGYPGTTGAQFIDYLIADSTLIPEDHQIGYTEKIVYLPDTYQVNNRLLEIAKTTDTRQDHGLPEEGFVFCCFNNNWKITPDLFDIWMKILIQVDQSVLWLFMENATAASNLIKEAISRGVNPDRLIFANKLPIDQHLARHKHADLFLDTIYCNAHTTASDALRSGLPVLTKLGNTYAGRVASSLLNAIGLPELITHTVDEYEALAINLATKPDRLSIIKSKLATNRNTTPLFDTPRFVRNLENAYKQMLERHQQGLMPDHIYVSNQA